MRRVRVTVEVAVEGQVTAADLRDELRLRLPDDIDPEPILVLTPYKPPRKGAIHWKTARVKLRSRAPRKPRRP